MFVDHQPSLPFAIPQLPSIYILQSKVVPNLPRPYAHAMQGTVLADEHALFYLQKEALP